MVYYRITSMISPNSNPSFIERHKGCLLVSFGCLSAIIVFIFIPLALFGLIIAGASNANNRKEAIITGSGDKKIAVLNIDGIILENEPVGGLTFTEDVTSARRVRKILNEIKEDPQVKAVLLRVNSPGGSAVASEDILRELKSFKSKSAIPIVAYFSDVAASGGYYVSMAADSIVANPSTITGSIGVIISYLNFADLAQRYGVRNIVYKSGQYKDIISEFREPSDEEKQIMQSVVGEAHVVFVKAVSEGRKLSLPKTQELANGRIYSALQAKEAGLVDNVGGFDDAIDVTKKLANLKEALVVEYGQPTFFELLLGSLFGKFNISILPQIDSYLATKPGIRLMYLYTP